MFIIFDTTTGEEYRLFRHIWNAEAYRDKLNKTQPNRFRIKESKKKDTLHIFEDDARERDKKQGLRSLEE